MIYVIRLCLIESKTFFLALLRNSISFTMSFNIVIALNSRLFTLFRRKVPHGIAVSDMKPIKPPQLDILRNKPSLRNVIFFLNFKGQRNNNCCVNIVLS